MSCLFFELFADRDLELRFLFGFRLGLLGRQVDCQLFGAVIQDVAMQLESDATNDTRELCGRDCVAPMTNNEGFIQALRKADGRMR
ncbi:hypothetical protein V474_16120 [Novosphingobium barchaimii LL02]|uniref:Uncharacterized protein n=1 Tax=Novosphingobium barchaimii LL02 TaxID=1114963 RepID=A0A0J8AQJ0_9SPHN|nr:hypothetical protein V474_16120 [Novosphingobium barchaimii LL02]